jgi:hypothetical protein
MCDLAIIARAGASNGTLSKAEKHRANVCLAGIIIYGTFAGRSQEWHAMLREDVLAVMRAGKDRIVCGKHKTAKYYGSIAKWVVSCTHTLTSDSKSN